MLHLNVTFRQSLLQLGNASVGDLGVVEAERLQLGQLLEMYQPNQLFSAYQGHENLNPYPRPCG